MVVTEFFSHGMRIPARPGNYYMEYARIEQAASFFAYHSQDDAMQHWSANTGRRPDIWEKAEIKSDLVRRGDQLRMSAKSPWCGISARGIKKEASMKDFIKPYYRYIKTRNMSRGKKAQGLEAHRRGASA